MLFLLVPCFPRIETVRCQPQHTSRTNLRTGIFVPDHKLASRKPKSDLVYQVSSSSEGWRPRPAQRKSTKERRESLLVDRVSMSMQTPVALGIQSVRICRKCCEADAGRRRLLSLQPATP